VDKIRKIVALLWYSKERLVLVIMVCFLCYRVYEVMYPPEDDGVAVTPSPPKPLPESNEMRAQLVGEVLPPLVPPRPRVDGPEDVASLYRRHPFWVASSPGAPAGDAATETADIELLDIQTMGNRVRARLRTGTTRSWYDEGAEFADYILEDIDPDARSVTVYATRLGERLNLNLDQGAS